MEEIEIDPYLMNDSSSKASTRSSSSRSSRRSTASRHSKAPIDNNSVLDLSNTEEGENDDKRRPTFAQRRRFLDELSVNNQLNDDDTIQSIHEEINLNMGAASIGSQHELELKEDDIEAIEKGFDKVTDEKAIAIIEALRGEFLKKKKKVEEEQEKIESLQKKIENKDADFLSVSVTDDEDDSMQSVIASVEGLKRKDMMHQDQLEYLNNEIVDMKKAIEIKNEEIVQKEASIIKLQKEKEGGVVTETTVSRLNEENGSLEKQKDVLLGRLNKLKTKREKIVDRVEKLNEYSAKLNAEKEKYETTVRNMGPAKQKLSEVEDKFQQLSKLNSKLRDSLEQKQKDFDFKKDIVKMKVKNVSQSYLVKLRKQKILDNEIQISALKEELKKARFDFENQPQPFPVVEPLFSPMKSPYAKNQ